MLVTGDTAGVDQNVGTPLPLGLTVLAITGQTGQVADDSVASPGQAVEQGGLADVRSAHQGDYGNHAALHFVYFRKYKSRCEGSGWCSGQHCALVCGSEPAPGGPTKNAGAPRLFRSPTSSLTSIASRLAPTFIPASEAA